MELWSGGTAVSGFVNGGTKLASVSFDHTSIAPNSFKELTLTYTATANDANLGRLLSIRFVKTSGPQMNLDNVRLNAVPEPTTLLALAIGGALLGRRRRQR